MLIEDSDMIECRQHADDIRDILSLYTDQEKITVEEAAEKLFVKQEDIEVREENTNYQGIMHCFTIKGSDLSIECNVLTGVDHIDKDFIEPEIVDYSDYSKHDRIRSTIDDILDEVMPDFLKHEGEVHFKESIEGVDDDTIGRLMALKEEVGEERVNKFWYEKGEHVFEVHKSEEYRYDENCYFLVLTEAEYLAREEDDKYEEEGRDNTYSPQTIDDNTYYIKELGGDMSFSNREGTRDMKERERHEEREKNCKV